MSEKFREYCTEEVFSDGGINAKHIHWFLIPSVLVLSLLSFLDKRKNIKPNLFGGRPALVRPLSFLDEPRNRLGILCLFGAITGYIIQVISRTFQAKFPIWAKIFMIYLLCLEICVVCYPLFACMTTRHKLVGAICGLLYSLGWCVFEMFANIQFYRCQAVFINTTNSFGAIIITTAIPVLICELMVAVKFCYQLFKCFKKRKYTVKRDEHVKLCSGHHIQYVRKLLAKGLSPENGETSLREKIITRFLSPVTGFRYTVTILSAAFMSSVILFMVALVFAETMAITIKAVELDMYQDLLTGANVVATLVTVLCGIKNIYVFLQKYRSHMLSLYRGDRSFIPESVQSSSPPVHMARGMRFLGTAIVGMFWGTVISYLFIFVPLALMLMVVRRLKDLGKLNKLMSQFEWIVYPVCMIVIFQIQTALIGRFLIQPKLNKKDRFKPLAVDNRNVYDILAFFFVFLNASIGVFTFLKRIVLGAIMGVFLLPRMDRSLLIQGYEAMDKCYVNYIGMLMMDLAHNHPVMRVFCHVIKEYAEITWHSRSMTLTAENPLYSCVSVQITPSRNENTVAKRRWLLAYTLINNPGLVNYRRNDRKLPGIDLRDIECTENGDEDHQEAYLYQKWKLWRRCECKFPRNLSTNLIAMLVLLIFAILYAGVPLVVEDII